ncbi:MAG: outer membrane beta-barrel protein [Desulfurivibrionaceae bacterium]
MNNKPLIIAGSIMLLSLSTSAYSATETPYLSGSLGIGFFNDAEVSPSDPAIASYDIEADPGFALAMAVGYDFTYRTGRMELEVVYQNNSLNKAVTAGGDVALAEDIDSFAVLTNGYWDFPTHSRWTPFLSAGLGLALVNVDDNTAYLGNDYDTVFAYQIGAGIGYAVNRKITVDCKYRYFATANAEFESGEVEYASHNIYAGMRYSF